jgi:hypothetical protein
VLPDIVLGDKSVVFLLTYESFDVFLQRSMADWRLSLPFSYAVVYLVVLPVHFLLGRFGYSGVATRVLTMALLSGLAAIFILRLDGWGAGVIVVAGALVSMLFHLSIAKWSARWGIGQ